MSSFEGSEVDEVVSASHNSSHYIIIIIIIALLSQKDNGNCNKEFELHFLLKKLGLG